MSGKQGQKSLKATDIQPRYVEDFMPSLDGRSLVARVLRDRFNAVCEDLGGRANMSYLEQSLVKRFVHMEFHTEKKELHLALGGRLDENVYLNYVNGLSGVSTKLGLKRRTKLVSLSEYIEAKASEPTAIPIKPAKGEKEPA